MNHIVRQVITVAFVAVAAALTVPATAQADTPPAPCSSGHVQVSNGGEQAAAGHRRVLLVFSLSPGAGACTLTGYPGVASGAGGPLIQAEWTLSGYMGGVQSETPAVVTVSASQPAYAVVEGAAVSDSDQPCPTYTDLRVIAPDTTDAVTVPAGIDACGLQVHPVSAQP
jgi:Protein of unknown function (DUF4232)